MFNIRKLMKLGQGIIATKLPRGMEEFDEFCRDIFDIYSLPDLPKYRHGICSLVMHLGPTTNKVSKLYLVKCLHKTDANEAAFEVLQKLKEEEKKKFLEEQKKREQEVLAEERSKVGEFNQD